MTSRALAGSASLAASCSRRSIGRRSRRCQASPTNIASGVCPGRHRLSRRHRRPLLLRPLPFAPAEVEARLTARGVEILHKGERIAVHIRASGNRKHTTIPEHMPSSHRRYAGWTIERIREDAQKIGRRPRPFASRSWRPGPIPSGGIVLVSASWSRRLFRRRARRGRCQRSRDRRQDLWLRQIHPRRQARSEARAKGARDIAPILHPNIRGPRYYHQETLTCSNIQPSIGFTRSAFMEWPGFRRPRRRRPRKGSAARRLARPAPRQGDVTARDKRLTARLRAAKLRQQASVEDVDYRAARGLDRALFQKLSTGEWIDAHDNLALVGPAGVGKSWLACAIGQKACRDNRSVLYHRWPKLCAGARPRRRRHPRLIKSLGRADLLILDDFGLEPLDAGARHDLLEILEERYGRRSTIVTS